MIMAEQFVHLHLHTEYSFPDGACRISDVLETAKMMGMDSVAITDHDAMYGFPFIGRPTIVACMP